MKNNMISKLILASSIALASSVLPIQAAEYKVDVEGAHAFVQFKIKHLGYSWLLGEFNTFDGNFTYDSKKPNQAKINIKIDTKSLDSNHAERDKHLKGNDFLNVDKFPKANFKSKEIKFSDETNAIVTGDLTLKGVTKTISFPISKIGEGQDPWGGYRVGFSGNTSLKLTDYGINYNLGPASTHVEMALHIEGVRL
ncbi:YceI family protein [Pseudoalteromonas sp. C2R02]|uniref:YceI family protein n=1 Tax=Pseudoalteromonas sp. C2R02 TaxID=2841565 RepID=UPI001C081832|nr:YceI family protein [Pseudoalteromonas sp. C2R02]MBU2969799.1 YceI family protein [Pseudoalteromonas sp. C2R02]